MSDTETMLFRAMLLLREHIDHEERSLDHHGYCQTHWWLENSPCINKQTKVLIEEYGRYLDTAAARQGEQAKGERG